MRWSTPKSYRQNEGRCPPAELCPWGADEFRRCVGGAESGKVAAYARILPPESSSAPRVCSSPHLGASTPESEDNCARMASAAGMDYLENGNIRNSVKYAGGFHAPRGNPHLHPAQECPQHHQPFLRRSRKGRAQYREYVQQVQKDYACTILDVTGDVMEQTVAAISSLGCHSGTVIK